MKKIIIGALVGFLGSLILFSYFWFKAADAFSMADISKERYCQGQQICSDCNRNYNCLMTKCANFPGDSCKYAELNFEPFSDDSEINKEDFIVSFLCGSLSSKSPVSCPFQRNKIAPFFKYGTFLMAFHYISLFFKIGYFLILIPYATTLMGVIIFLIPTIIGFYIGLWLKIRKT